MTILFPRCSRRGIGGTFWRRSEYDLVLAYRPHNVAEFKPWGLETFKLLRSW